jgi:XTP/dITP diphosphohydrolase
MELIIATSNQHKVDEIRAALPEGFSIISLRESGIGIDIPEPWSTLEENAREKAEVIHRLTGKSCFSEDTGLEVPALNNEPGVRSARYAGDQANAAENLTLLLNNMASVSDRTARFRTVICLILQEKLHYFEGICNGRITSERSGEGGFGYDPVFIPDGASVTFGEMDMNEKNRFSHRKKAVDKLVVFLNQQI